MNVYTVCDIVEKKKQAHFNLTIEIPEFYAFIRLSEPKDGQSSSTTSIFLFVYNVSSYCTDVVYYCINALLL